MKERLFKRKIYTQLLNWKQESDGKSALLVEGARRVGKSTIVETFAKNEYESYLLIDFNKASKAIKDLFNDLMDLDYLFLYLQTAYHVTLKPRESVIIFDEVQKCPMARQAIKYLVEDGRYDYIETGSLISIKKNTDGITIPSEEDRIQMNPMDFEEFRWALGDEATVPLLRKFWEQQHALGPAHREMARNLRLYMLVGGMPQAVNAYLDTNNFSKVDQVKRRILKLYEDDFLKIDPSGRASVMFRSVPGQLSRNAIRYVPYAVVGRVDDEKMTELLKDLEDSKTVNMCYHVNDPQVGMGLTKTKTNSRCSFATRDCLSRWRFGTRALQRISFTRSFWQTNYQPIWAMYMRTLSARCWWLQGMNSSTTLGHVMRNTTMRLTSYCLVEQRFVL